MGSQQQFCLRWNNHQSNMLSVFDDLFQNEALVDVTLACDGLSIKAHKMVLSACSPYFQNLFLDNPCKHPIVILKDIRFSDLKALMDFMYKGEVNVSQEQLSTLLRTAETLKVRGLTEVAGGSNDLNNSLLSSHHQSGQQQNIVPQTLQQPQQQQQQQQPSQVAAAAAVPTQMQQQQQPRPNGMNQGTLSSSSTTTTTTMVGQSHRSTSSPSPKRKKTRHRHKSDPNSSQSDYEDSGDSRSHELIEPKVEITEENIETDEQLQSDAANNKGLATTGQSRTLVANNLGTSGGGEFATNSHNTQGVSSSQEGSPANDSQGFTVRAANLPMNAKPAALFNQAATSGNVQTLTSVQSIGQPPVLQGSSQALPAATQMPLMIASSTMMSVSTAAAPSTSRQDSGPRDPIPCKICQKVISNIYNMKKHMVVHATNRREYKCRVCNGIFSHEDSFRRHLRKKHDIAMSELKKYMKEI